MSRRWKYWFIGSLITIGAATGAQLLSRIGLFQFIAAKAYDAHFVLRGKQPTEGMILVGADQKALEAFREPQLFWHPYYADAIKGAEMGGAKLVGIDHAFGIPVERWAKDNDDIIANAVATAQIPVVVGFVPALASRQQEFPIKVNMLASALGLSGYANLTADSDDFIRRQELIEAPAADVPTETLARSFAMRLAEKATASEVQLEKGRLTLAGKTIPIDGNRTIRINFAGPAETFPRVSLADFVAAAREGKADQLRKWVQGKIVLIGPDALDDRYPTPYFTTFQPGKWTTPGFEIHANTLRTILTGQYMLSVPLWVEYPVLIAVGMLTFIAAAGLRTSLVALSSVAVLAAALGGSHLLFLSRLTMSDSDITGAWLLSLVASIVYRFVSAENRRDLFRRAVTMFVGKQVATSLDTSTTISRTGQSQNVTILFTDIRGFTAFCEGKDPSYIVDLLNQYLTQMVSIIFRHGGHVNKFIGDGILAVFSDGDPGSKAGDHALRGVRCAAELVTAPNEFNTGAGLHSGPVVVGNIGSEDKMEYTVLGDTVNLASRLESLNKEHKTSVLISGVTRAGAGGEMEMTRLGAVPVRGKTEPVEIYTVTALLGNYEARSHATGKGAK